MGKRELKYGRIQEVLLSGIQITILLNRYIFSNILY